MCCKVELEVNWYSSWKGFSLTAPTEVERFVELNTQKLSEHKYLCPLSGKKFKGPEFVRKHIFNKHMEKVEAARQEVGVAVGVAVGI